MKKMAMSTILAAGFTVASLLPTLPMAYAVAGNVAGQPDDPIAMAYRRTLEEPANSAAIGSPDDPIAMAYRRTLDSTNDTSIHLVGGETPDDFNTPHAVNEPPIRILMRLSKGEL